MRNIAVSVERTTRKKLVFCAVLVLLMPILSSCTSSMCHYRLLAWDEPTTIDDTQYFPYYASYSDCMIVVAPLYRKFWKTPEFTMWPYMLIYVVIDLPFSAMLDTAFLPYDLSLPRTGSDVSDSVSEPITQSTNNDSEKTK